MRLASDPPKRGRRGFVIGELLIAFLLLAVAVSSLAALMYSVSRRPATREETACVGKNTTSAKCIAQATGGPSKLLRSGCATRTGPSARSCKDSLMVTDSSGNDPQTPHRLCGDGAAREKGKGLAPGRKT